MGKPDPAANAFTAIYRKQIIEMAVRYRLPLVTVPRRSRTWQVDVYGAGSGEKRLSRGRRRNRCHCRRSLH
jgi:hypothetical protein